MPTGGGGDAVPPFAGHCTPECEGLSSEVPCTPQGLHVRLRTHMWLK